MLSLTPLSEEFVNECDSGYGSDDVDDPEDLTTNDISLSEYVRHSSPLPKNMLHKCYMTGKDLVVESKKSIISSFLNLDSEAFVDSDDSEDLTNEAEEDDSTSDEEAFVDSDDAEDLTNEAEEDDLVTEMSQALRNVFSLSDEVFIENNRTSFGTTSIESNSTFIESCTSSESNITSIESCSTSIEEISIVIKPLMNVLNSLSSEISCKIDDDHSCDTTSESSTDSKGSTSDVFNLSDEIESNCDELELSSISDSDELEVDIHNSGNRNSLLNIFNNLTPLSEEVWNEDKENRNSLLSVFNNLAPLSEEVWIETFDIEEDLRNEAKEDLTNDDEEELSEDIDKV